MFQLKNVKTYYGANPYINKRAMVFDVAYDVHEDQLNFENRAHHITDALPVDFEEFDFKKKKSPADYASYLLLGLLNYIRGDLRFSFAENNKIIIDFHDPKVNFFVLKVIVKWFQLGVFDINVFQVDLRNIFDLCKTKHPDFQAHALIEYAKSNNISYHSVGKKIWVYGTGSGAHTFFETSMLKDMSMQRLSKDKCKSIFNDVGVRSPNYLCRDDFTNLDEVVEKIKFPCVVKPNDSGGGKGVIANINDINQLGFAINHAKAHSKSGALIIEEHLLGFDHRILIVGGEFKGCVKSEAPYIIGDDIKTVNDLISEKNKFRTLSFYRSGYKRPVIIDDALINKLDIQNLKLSDILDSGQKVYLRNNSNLGGGGDSFFVNDVHPDIINQALRIADHVGMFSTGIDYITEDISKSPDIVDGGFTELNKTPGVPVFVNAGFSPEKVGSFFLKGTCWDVPLDVYIVTKKMQESKKLFNNSYIFPNFVKKNDNVYKLNNSSFDECWGRYASDRSLDRLQFVINEDQLKNFGVLEGADNVLVFSSCSVDTRDFLEKCNVEFSIID